MNSSALSVHELIDYERTIRRVTSSLKRTTVTVHRRRQETMGPSKKLVILDSSAWWKYAAQLGNFPIRGDWPVVNEDFSRDYSSSPPVEALDRS